MPMFMQYIPFTMSCKKTLLQIIQLEFFVNNTSWLDQRFVKLVKLSGREESPQS